jgi:UPF0755 protein
MILSKFKSLVVTFAISLLFLSTLLLSSLFLPSDLAVSKNLIIPKDSTILRITKILEEEGIIKSAKLFYPVSLGYSWLYKLRSGEYALPAFATPIQVLSIISAGKSVVHKLVIAEGTTVAEIISKLKSESLLEGDLDEFIEEGSLMPSTYFFYYGDKRNALIKQMKNLMSQNVKAVFSLIHQGSTIKTPNELATLASIVEKEAKLDSERPKIAAVFLNRLKKGMRLQADPTTAYAVTEGKVKLDRSLTKKDLAIKSPYNTYIVSGLPPTPICCPGLKSLLSVANPEDTDDLYFVVDGYGGHNFSKNLTEHSRNVKNYKTLQKTNSEHR